MTPAMKILRRQIFFLSIVVLSVVSYLVTRLYFDSSQNVASHRIHSKLQQVVIDDSGLVRTGPAYVRTAETSMNITSHSENQLKCVDPCDREYCDRVEDILCLKKPAYLVNYKNPCWYEQEYEEEFRLTCLPYFHVLGVDKSGSTDLFARIAQHPQVLNNSGGIGKETYFWCWNRVEIWMKSVNMLHVHFTLRTYARRYFALPAKEIEKQSRNGYHRLVTGDGTPMDFWDMRGWPKLPQNRGLKEPVVLTPHLMKHVYRDPKFIVIFRNPTDRLYSDYYFLGYGDTPQSFHKHALQAVEMMRSCFQRTGSQRLCIFDADMYARLPMRIHIGCYSVFLKEWLSVFSRDSFLFLKTEVYNNFMGYVLSDVFDFLDLDPLSEEELAGIARQRHKHITAVKVKKGPMLNETKVLLDNFYAPFKKEMAAILNDERWLWNPTEE